MEEVALEVELDNLRTALDLETLDDNGAIHVDQNVKDEKGSDEKLSDIGNVLVIEIEGLAKGSHPDDPEVGDQHESVPEDEVPAIEGEWLEALMSVV